MAQSTGLPPINSQPIGTSDPQIDRGTVDAKRRPRNWYLPGGAVRTLRQEGTDEMHATPLTAGGAH